ncbi:hypothetical protein V8E36_000165 [Tilletia maclaganii]
MDSRPPFPPFAGARTGMGPPGMASAPSTTAATQSFAPPPPPQQQQQHRPPAPASTAPADPGQRGEGDVLGTSAIYERLAQLQRTVEQLSSFNSDLGIGGSGSVVPPSRSSSAGGSSSAPPARAAVGPLPPPQPQLAPRSTSRSSILPSFEERERDREQERERRDRERELERGRREQEREHERDTQRGRERLWARPSYLSSSSSSTAHSDRDRELGGGGGGLGSMGPPPTNMSPPPFRPDLTPLPSFSALSASIQRQQSFAEGSPAANAMHKVAKVLRAARGNDAFSSQSPGAENRPSSFRLPMPHKRATIVLIGMRGTGKTTLGLIAANAYNRRFIDIDSVLEKHTGMTSQAFVAKHGWEEYLEQETDVFESVLVQHPWDAIICCGGSIVENGRAKGILLGLRLKQPVVHVLREREDVIPFLMSERHKSRYDGDVVEIWKARDPFFWILSSHVFVNLSQPLAYIPTLADQPRAKHPLALKPVEHSFLRMLDFMSAEGREASAEPPENRTPSLSTSSAMYAHMTEQLRPRDEDTLRPGERDQVEALAERIVRLPGVADVTDRESFFSHGRTSYLSLTFPDLKTVDPLVFEQVIEGVDAIELRADLLDCMAPASKDVRLQLLKETGELSGAPQIDFAELAIQIECARSLSNNANLPLIFTIRTSREGGLFYDDRDHASGSMESPHSEPLYFLLLSIALSMGVEIVDMELAWSTEQMQTLALRRGHTKIMCSYHDLAGALKWDLNSAPALYERACSFDPDYVEIIGTAHHVDQNWHLLSFASLINSAAACDSSRPPLLALNMGEHGRPSRPFQPILAPVGHPLQPTLAAPGQMSLQEITEVAAKLGILKARKFVVFDALGQDEVGERDAVEGSSALSVRVLRQAIARIGLPYEIVLEHETGRMTMLDHFLSSAFGGAIIPGADLQTRLFDIAVQEDTLFSLSEDAAVLGAVDQVCLTEIEAPAVAAAAPSALLAPGMTHTVPNCIAHHSLSATMEQGLANHLSPLNRPSPQSSALIVIFGPASATAAADDRDGGLEQGVEIGLKSAARAILKLGYRYCAVVQAGGAPIPASESKLTALVGRLHTLGSRKTEEKTKDTKTGADLLNKGDSKPKTRFELQPISALSDLTSIINSRKRASAPPGRDKAVSPGAASGTSPAPPPPRIGQTSGWFSGGSGSSSATTAEALGRSTTPPLRPPSAVLFIGGSEAQHELALLALRGQVGTEQVNVAFSEDSAQAVDAGLLTTAEREGLPLPAELWNSPLGGAILSFPATKNGSSSTRDPPKPSTLVPKLLRRGWISVPSGALELERLAHGVFEPWTRKRAPRATMRAAYLGQKVGTAASLGGAGGGTGAAAVGQGADGGGPASGDKGRGKGKTSAGNDDMDLDGDQAPQSLDKVKGKGKARVDGHGGSGGDSGAAADTLAGMRYS